MDKIRKGDPNVDFCVVRVVHQAIVPVGCENAAKRVLADELYECVKCGDDDVLAMFDVDAADEDIDWSDVSKWACGDMLLDEDEED